MHQLMMVCANDSRPSIFHQPFEAVAAIIMAKKSVQGKAMISVTGTADVSGILAFLISNELYIALELCEYRIIKITVHES